MNRSRRFYPSARVVAQIAPDTILLQLPRGAAPIVTVDLATLEFLRSCTGLRSVAEHIDNLRNVWRNLEPSVLADSLNLLIQADLVREYQESGELCERKGAAPIRTIGIVTADRPKKCLITLRTLLAHCERSGRQPRVIVVDGSVQESNARWLRQALSAPDVPTDVKYVGRAEVSRIRQRLCAAGLSPTFVRRHIRIGQRGPNRNLLLLLTAGERFLMIDDDVLMDPWEADNRQPGRRVVGQGSRLYDWKFFASRREATAAARRVSVDLLAAHANLMGQTLSGLLAKQAAAVEPGQHLIDAIAKGSGPRVRAVMAGLAGDSASSPLSLLFGNGPGRERICHSEQTFNLAMSSREVHRIATTESITDDPHCMSYCLSVDNEMLLPPFLTHAEISSRMFRTLANEDGAFGLTLRAIDPQSLFGHLAFGIVHDSVRNWCYDDRAWLFVTATTTAEVVQALTRHMSSALVCAEPSDRLRRLATFIHDVSRLAIADFESLLVEQVAATKGRIIGRSHSNDQPRHNASVWRSRRDTEESRLLVNMTERSFFVPVEFASATVEQGFQNARDFLAAQADLAEVWPDLWELSRTASLVEVIDQR